MDIEMPIMDGVEAALAVIGMYINRFKIFRKIKSINLF